MIDVTLGLRCYNQYESSFYTCRSWRSFNYDDFERELRLSDPICSHVPPSTLCGNAVRVEDPVHSSIWRQFQRRSRSALVMHRSCGTRSTESPSRRLHLSLHTMPVIWRRISSVRSTRSVLTPRRCPCHMSQISHAQLFLCSSW